MGYEYVLKRTSFHPVCVACEKPIEVGEKVHSNGHKRWHLECFRKMLI
jgi:predicted nucleic acid-binding Zn ribbon protein